MADTFDSTLEILIAVSDLVFDGWPLLLLAPLTWRKMKRNRLLPAMISMWAFVAALRGLTLLSPEPPISLVIDEPLNTLLFVLAGIILLALHFLLSARQRRLFTRKTGSVRSVEDLLNLSPVEFEDMVVALYEQAGHQAKRTGKTGDHGVDVTVKAKNGETWVIQCKRWRGTVGEPIVRDFYGVMQHEKAHRGIIITSGRFSRPALAWAKGKPLALYNGEHFLQLWQRMQTRKQSQPAPSLPPVEPQPERI